MCTTEDKNITHKTMGLYLLIFRFSTATGHYTLQYHRRRKTQTARNNNINVTANIIDDNYSNSNNNLIKNVQ